MRKINEIILAVMNTNEINLRYGVKYVFKELAFFLAVRNFYEDCQEVGMSSLLDYGREVHEWLLPRHCKTMFRRRCL